MISAPGGRVTLPANFDDACCQNQDFAGSDDVAGFDVKQARGMEDDGVSGW